jgi:hypothetical protein
VLRKSDVWRRQSRRRCGASPGADVGRASPGADVGPVPAQMWDEPVPAQMWGQSRRRCGTSQSRRPAKMWGQSRRRCGTSQSWLVLGGDESTSTDAADNKGQRGQTSIATSIIALQHRNKHHSIATSIIALQHRNRHEKPAGARPSSRPQCLLRRRVPALRPPETHRMPLLSCEQFGSEASPRPATAARAAAAASPPFRACSAPSRPPPSLRGAPVVGTCTVGQSTRRFTTRVHSAVCESGCSGRPAL